MSIGTRALQNQQGPPLVGITLWRPVKISPPSSGEEFRNANEPFRYQVTATTPHIYRSINVVESYKHYSHTLPGVLENPWLFLDCKCQVSRWRWLTPIKQQTLFFYGASQSITTKKIRLTVRFPILSVTERPRI